MRRLSRRKFLGKSVAAVASASLLPAVAAEQDPKRATAQSTAVARVVGANAAIGFAVVGFHGRGANHIEGMSAVKGTRMVALCDVDQQVLDREVQKCKNQGVQVAAYTDIRKLLEDRNVDVITIATPNHWHALASIWAVQAGKDVYVEKPVSHNVSGGRRIVEFARHHNRICQTGTQIRSQPGIRQAMDFVSSGQLGRVLVARGLC